MPLTLERQGAEGPVLCEMKNAAKSKMRKKREITLIPGDGIGPELCDAVRRILEAAGAAIEWDVVEAGSLAFQKYGSPLPPQVLTSIRRTGVALKGPIGTPIGTGFRSANVALRHSLDLFACVRPCRLLPGIQSPYPDVDLVIIRENTEDLYTGIEFAAGSPEIAYLMHSYPEWLRPDTAISIKPISRSASKRIAEFAFQYAVRYQRKKVTAVTKANIMKFTDGLF